MNYYKEIENVIKKNEVNKRTRILEENQDILKNYWNIEKLLVEAQGGEKRAKYGNTLIKKWAFEFTEKYGSGYSDTNLKRFRQFYIYFSKGAPLEHLSWTNIKVLLPIKEENRRNYYINQCIERNLSRRELEKEIKNNSYERLIDKSEKIELHMPIQKKTIFENMKNPILLELNEGEFIHNEHDLELIILSKLKVFFSQLGNGFLFAENQYKITVEIKIIILIYFFLMFILTVMW